MKYFLDKNGNIKLDAVGTRIRVRSLFTRLIAHLRTNKIQRCLTSVIRGVQAARLICRADLLTLDQVKLGLRLISCQQLQTSWSRLQNTGLFPATGGLGQNL